MAANVFQLVGFFLVIAGCSITIPFNEGVIPSKKLYEGTKNIVCGIYNRHGFEINYKNVQKRVNKIAFILMTSGLLLMMFCYFLISAKRMISSITVVAISALIIILAMMICAVLSRKQ